MTSLETKNIKVIRSTTNMHKLKKIKINKQNKDTRCQKSRHKKHTSPKEITVKEIKEENKMKGIQKSKNV